MPFTNPRYEYLTREYATVSAFSRAPDHEELVKEGWAVAWSMVRTEGTLTVYEREKVDIDLIG